MREPGTDTAQGASTSSERGGKDHRWIDRSPPSRAIAPLASRTNETATYLLQTLRRGGGGDSEVWRYHNNHPNLDKTTPH